MKISNWFKSKEERERERAERELRNRMAVNKGIRSLKQWEQTMETKKNQMVALAREAQSVGLDRQYETAMNGLKMMLKSQKYARSMRLQIEIASTMNELNTMSANFAVLMGDLGRHVQATTSSANLLGNQEAFTTGMASIEGTLAQLEEFMHANEDSFDSAAMDTAVSEDELLALLQTPTESSRAEAPRTAIAAEGGATDSSPHVSDDDIERRLRDLRP